MRVTGDLLAVVQDDILHEDLTVREILGYSAWLRSTVHMVSEAKGEVVDDVIDLLRLRHVQVHLHPAECLAPPCAHLADRLVVPPACCRCALTNRV